MKDPRQSRVSETTHILVCRDIELTGEDRREIERSEAAFAHVLPKIHRIEWTVTARPRTVEVRASLHAQEGDFEAKAAAKDARTAIQEATKKLMMQKRNLKETRLGSRREASLARPIAMNF